jgi:hypothetical protein
VSWNFFAVQKYWPAGCQTAEKRPGTVLLLCLCGVFAHAQQPAARSLHTLQNWVNPGNNRLVRASARIGSIGYLESKKPILPEFLPEAISDFSTRASPQPCWSADDLPFFCRIEHDLGKKTQVPVKFRLGSVDYVDWLEGKRPHPF